VAQNAPYPDIWEHLKQRLAAKLPSSQYQNWMVPTELGSFENGELIIHVPDVATAEWIRDEYSPQIWEGIRELKALVKQIRYVCPSLNPRRSFTPTRKTA
jgi:chromosomal replication initiation ATPase DnaA